MTSEQHRRVRELFEAAVDRDARRASIVGRRAGRRDPAVRDEILSLLDHHERAGAFLSEPIVERVPELLAEEAVLLPGTVLGAYTIIRRAGPRGHGTGVPRLTRASGARSPSRRWRPT